VVRNRSVLCFIGAPASSFAVVLERHRVAVYINS
jgi:hypothetical protein